MHAAIPAFKPEALHLSLPVLVVYSAGEGTLDEVTLFRHKSFRTGQNGGNLNGETPVPQGVVSKKSDRGRVARKVPWPPLLDCLEIVGN